MEQRFLSEVSSGGGGTHDSTVLQGGEYPPLSGHKNRNTSNLLATNGAGVNSLQHHLAEGHMVTQIHVSKCSVVQGLFFNEIRRSHLKRRPGRSVHP